MPKTASHPIEDHGVIGDLHTVALVNTRATIDFLCLPDFDSATMFAALLDPLKGGHFSISPFIEGDRRRQMYLPDTNILVTRYLSENAVAEITDFMPVDPGHDRHRVVRTVHSVKGQMRFRVQCCPRFDYGRKSHVAHQLNAHAIEFTLQDHACPTVRLIGRTPLEINGPDGESAFSLDPGEEVSFIFEWGVGHNPPLRIAEETVRREFSDTSAYWRNWAAQSTYQGRWREMVARSALLLKLLTSEKHGSIIAAPSFGLPEQLGGVRN
ncbi:MAG TPA: trehalase-like domain-containing protein [Bryobacteraceae bacterium]|nr:trehalase-like domain-containing protein [Bryobacteraceae bacterium]